MQMLFFFPDFFFFKISRDKYSPMAQELLMVFDLLYDDDLKTIAVKQIKELSGYNPDV